MESTGGSPARGAEDWSNKNQIFNSWIDSTNGKALLLANFRDKKIKAFDLEHLVTFSASDQLNELFQFNCTPGCGSIKYCGFQDLKLIVAGNHTSLYKVEPKDFDRFHAEKVTVFDAYERLESTMEFKG
jgi:hypothetical protein